MSGELLKMDIPEILCDLGVKSEAKEMIKAHNKMISQKASAFDKRNKVLDRFLTPKEVKIRSENQQKQLLSSFEDPEYRAAAKRFLEVVLSKVKTELSRRDAEVDEAAARYKEAAAKLKEASEKLENCRSKRESYYKDLSSAVIVPFLYANTGAGMLPEHGYNPQRLYPQLGFMIPSYNFEPVQHIEYMLQEINRFEY